MRLTVPLERRVTITVRDFEPFTCMFKQPRQKDSLARSDLLSQMEAWSAERVKAYDVHFLLRECGIEKEDESPLWHPTRLQNGKLTLKQFLGGWGKLPPEVGNAIWEAAMEVAPSWDWRRQRTEEGSFREWEGAAEAPEG